MVNSLSFKLYSFCLHIPVLISKNLKISLLLPGRKSFYSLLLSNVLKFYWIKISSAEQCGVTTSPPYCRESRQKVFTHSHQQSSGADPHGMRKRKTGLSNTKLVIKIGEYSTQSTGARNAPFVPIVLQLSLSRQTDWRTQTLIFSICWMFLRWTYCFPNYPCTN